MIRERYILILLLIVLAIGITYRFLDSINPNPKVIDSVRESKIVRSKEKDVSSGKINLNTAEFSDFLRLPGIGKVKARAILDYREKNGGFKSVEEIMKVPGIGKKTFERIRDMIFVEGSNEGKGKKDEDEMLIDVNTATLEELMRLPGIGEVKAREIIEYRRTHGFFRTVDELLNVRGIGKKTLERLRRYIKVGGR